MNRPDHETLSRVSADTLEKLTFLLCSYEEEEALPGSEARSWSGASVTFEGPLKGSLMLLFSEDIVHEIAMNMLGSEEPLTRDQEQDALGEAANVLCGNLLPLIAGADAVFSIGSPRVWEGKGLAKLPERNGVSQAFFETTLSVEEGKCRIFLFVRKNETVST